MKVLSRAGIACLGFLAACAAVAGCSSDDAVTDRQVDHPGYETAGLQRWGSTHEIAFDRDGRAWLTGQDDDAVTIVDEDGSQTQLTMPPASGPHGIVIDGSGNVWVTLELAGAIARISATGEVLQSIDLSGTCEGCLPGGNPGPHGLAVGHDGASLWYTGKEGGTIGRIGPDGTLASFALPDPTSKPIHIVAGPDGAMWFTELEGNRIGRIDDSGSIREHAIPTPGSRPIALAVAPDREHLWFTEEAGGKLGRIALDGTIEEVGMPRSDADHLLASLAFDRDGDLWVQQYIARGSGSDAHDRILRVGSRLLERVPAALDEASLEVYTVPTPHSLLHRIAQAPDGSIWFTELAADRIGIVHDH